MMKGIRLPLLWSVAYILLLLSFISPLNMLTIHFIMVLPLYLFMKTDLKQVAIVYVFNGLLLYLLFGGLGVTLALISLFFLPPALVMGYRYKKKAPARNAILTGVLTFLGEMMLLLVVSRLMGYNLIKSFEASLRSSLAMWKSILKADMIETAIYYVVQMLPFFLLAFAVYYVLVTHGIGRRMLRSSYISVPGLPPLRQWKLPKSLVWYFVAATVLDFMITRDADPLLQMVVLNVLPVLTIIFAVQALSFIFYFIHVRRKSKALPIAAIVLMILWPSSLYLFSILGLLDTIFPIREKLADKS